MAHAALPAPYWRLMAARFFSTFATQMLAVVVGWQVYAHTHSPLALGAVGLAEALPALSLALWAGFTVDHGDPERIFRTVLACTGVAALALWFTFWRAPAGGDNVALAALYAVSVAMGAARAYYQPCNTVLLPKLVTPAELPRAAALGGSTMQLARVLGPALGGLIYGFVGPLGALSVVCVLLVASVLALGRRNLLPKVTPAAVHRPDAPVRADGVDGADGLTAAASLAHGPADSVAKAAPRLTTALFEGVHYVRRSPVLLSALSLDMVCVFFGSVTAVLPIFAEQVLMCGPKGLGVLRAAPAFGAVMASLVLARVDVRPRAGVALLWAVAGFGGCTLAFALSRNFALSLAILVLSGMLDSVSVLVRQLIVQLMSPAHMRGRIAAVNAMFIGSSNEIGELESGVAAAALGLVPSVLFGGTVCLVVLAVTAARVGTLRRLDLRQATPTA